MSIEKKIVDCDFAEIEKRILLQMEDHIFKAPFKYEGSVTGRIPAKDFDLSRFQFPKRG